MLNSVFLKGWLFMLLAGSILIPHATIAQPFLQYDPKTRKTGVWDAATYQPILPCAFDDVSIQNGKDLLIVATNDGKKALYDGKGKQLVPFFDQLHFTMMSAPELPEWVVVGSDLPEGMRYGIYRPGKGLVLPVKYKEVYAIYPDLIAGRVENPPQEIHFFDEKGTFLYAKEGNSAGRGYNDQTIILRRPGKDWLHYDKQGNDPFPPGFTRPVWMEDSLIIAGEKDAVGLFRLNGDTVLSPVYTNIQKEGTNRFIVRSPKREWGLSDEKGRFLIGIQPFYGLNREHWEQQEVYISRSTEGGTSNVYDRDGNLLLEQVQISFPSLMLINQLPQQEPWRYLTFRKKEGTRLGLYHKDGRQILPMEFNSIQYYSELHPLLASKEDATQPGVYQWQAYNKQGKALLNLDLKEIKGTASPEWFIGLPMEKGAKWGFISLKKPAEAQYIYDQIIPVLHGLYAGQLGGRWYLLNVEGKKVHAKGFDVMTDPMNLQLNQFYVEKHKGPLVAAAFEKGAPSGNWVALTRRGLAIPMTPPPYNYMIEENMVDMIEEVMAEEAPPPPPVVEEVVAVPPSSPVNIQTIPSFPGGEPALQQYLKEQVKYPELAKKNGIQGRVVLGFQVEADGSLSSIKILRDIGGGCGEEAIRVVKGMPKWLPGKNNGVPAPREYTLMVTFKAP
jgi:TonB family protein